MTPQPGKSPHAAAVRPMPPAMPLVLAARGQEVVLGSVRGGRGLQHRLAELGLTPGVKFRVLASGGPGPFIILLKGARLLLGHGMVQRISVHPV